MSAEQERMPQRQLGQLMTELGLISAEQLATVLEVQQRSKRPIGQIIVELGFASGAAVAHALAMQSGGALRTESGSALGVPPVDGNADSEETAGGLPKLRLGAPAVQPIRTQTAPADEVSVGASEEPDGTEAEPGETPADAEAEAEAEAEEEGEGDV